MSLDQYRVTAPYVVLKVSDGLGSVSMQGFYRDAIFGSDQVEEKSLKRHLDRGMVEKFADRPEDAQPEPQTEPPEGDEPKKPGQNDLKEAWVDYAVAQGYDRDEVDEMSKADLIDLFK